MSLEIDYELENLIREDLEKISLFEPHDEDFLLEREIVARVCRKLGPSERITWLSDRAGCANFVVVARIVGLLDERILRKALDILPMRHPLLRTRIKIQEDGPIFVSENVPPIPLRVAVRRSDNHWHAEVEEEINHTFTWFTGPLMRVTLLESPSVSDVLITFHHAIGDGMSSMYLVRDLLTLVAHISGGMSPDITTFPVRPPVEALLPKDAHGVIGLIKTINLLGKQLTNIIFRHPQKIPTSSNTLPDDRFAHIIHCAFSPEETTSLITRCREEGTTVHGALCAALLKAVAHEICAARSHKKPLTIGCMSAVDLRKFLNPPIGEEVGFFISMAVTAHSVSNGVEFWDLARNAKKAVHQSIENKEPFVFLSLMDRFLANDANPNDIVNLASRIYPSAMLLTNLGRIHIPETYGSLILQEVHFAVTNKAIAEHFNVAIVTHKNRLIVNFSYTEPALSKKRASNLAENAMKILRSSLSSE